MSPKPVIPFRQRLLEDMDVRHFGEKSKHDYLRHIDRIALSSLLPQLNEAPKSQTSSGEAERCPKCGGRLHVILRFEGACRRRKTAPATTRFDTS